MTAMGQGILYLLGFCHIFQLASCVDHVPSWNAWGPWHKAGHIGVAACHVTRERICPTQHDKDCLGSSKEEHHFDRTCKLVTDVDLKMFESPHWLTWGNWEHIDAGNSYCIFSRIRNCSTYDMKDCNGTDYQEKQYTMACADVPRWSKWTPWLCAYTGRGECVSHRWRSCTDNTTTGCVPDQSFQIQQCSLETCNGPFWLPWSEWRCVHSEDAPCHMERRRECSTRDATDCKLGVDTEKKQCDPDVCGKPTWLKWGDWNCTQYHNTCYMERFRNCSTGYNSECAQHGLHVELMICDNIHCWDGPHWMPWGSYSCDYNNGHCFQTRFRNCSTDDPTDCHDGLESEIKLCEPKFCPAAVWSTWGSYICEYNNRTCFMKRFRNCSTGETGDCAGHFSEVHICNKTICPDPSYSEWGSWSCIEIKHQCFQQRLRTCSTGKTYDCTGRFSDIRPCIIKCSDLSTSHPSSTQQTHTSDPSLINTSIHALMTTSDQGPTTSSTQPTNIITSPQYNTNQQSNGSAIQSSTTDKPFIVTATHPPQNLTNKPSSFSSTKPSNTTTHKPVTTSQPTSVTSWTEWGAYQCQYLGADCLMNRFRSCPTGQPHDCGGHFSEVHICDKSICPGETATTASTLSPNSLVTAAASQPSNAPHQTTDSSKVTLTTNKNIFSTDVPAVSSDPLISTGKHSSTTKNPPVSTINPTKISDTPTSSTDNPAIITSNPFVTTKDPAVTTDKQPITTKTQSVTINNPTLTTQNHPLTTKAPPVSTDKHVDSTVKPVVSTTVINTQTTSKYVGFWSPWGDWICAYTDDHNMCFAHRVRICSTGIKSDCEGKDMDMDMCGTFCKHSSSSTSSSPPPTTVPVSSAQPQTNAPASSSQSQTNSPVSSTQHQTNAPVSSSQTQTNTPASSTQPQTNAPASSIQPQTNAPASSPQPQTNAPASSPQPQTNAPASSIQPQTNAPASSTQPQTNAPASSTQQQTNAPASSTQPQTNTPASSTQPQTNAPASSTQPQTNAPASSTQPHTNAPASSTQPQTNAPASSNRPQTNAPASLPQPQTNAPASSTQPQTNAPASSPQPQTNAPASSTQQQTNAPASSMQPQTNTPASSTQPQTNAPASSTQPQTNASVSSMQPQTNSPASSTQPQTNAPVSSSQPQTNVPASSTQPQTNAPASSTQTQTNVPASSTQPQTNAAASSKQPQTNAPVSTTPSETTAPVSITHVDVSSQPPQTSAASQQTFTNATIGTTPAPVVCAICDGPPDICEMAYVFTTCSHPTNLCLNRVTNTLSGSRTVSRQCMDRSTCYREWYLGSSDNDRCQDFDPNNIYTLNFDCVFCCTTDKCNEKLVPDRNTLM